MSKKTNKQYPKQLLVFFRIQLNKINMQGIQSIHNKYGTTIFYEQQPELKCPMYFLIAFTSSQKQCLEGLKLLVKLEVDLNRDGRLAFMLAKEGQVLGLDYLLTNNDFAKVFDLNMVNSKGENLLMIAATYNRMRLLGYLIKHKINLAYRDQTGKSALTCAVTYGHINIVKELIDHVGPLSKQEIDNLLIQAGKLEWKTVKQYLESLINPMKKVQHQLYMFKQNKVIQVDKGTLEYIEAKRIMNAPRMQGVDPHWQLEVLTKLEKCLRNPSGYLKVPIKGTHQFISLPDMYWKLRMNTYTQKSKLVEECNEWIDKLSMMYKNFESVQYDLEELRNILAEL